MAIKQNLIDELVQKFKLVVEGTTQPETTNTAVGGETVSLYNIGVMDEDANGAIIGRRIKFYVINEGLETESAHWIKGQEPKTVVEIDAEPSREKRLKDILLSLQAQGTVRSVDLSHLQIPYATLEVAGVKTDYTMLDGELIPLEKVV